MNVSLLHYRIFLFKKALNLVDHSETSSTIGRLVPHVFKSMHNLISILSSYQACFSHLVLGDAEPFCCFLVGRPFDSNFWVP